MNLGKRTLPIVSALLLAALCSRADEPKIREPKIRLNFVESDETQVLWYYGRWTGRKVWRTLDLRQGITLNVDGEIPLSAAAEYLRTALLEKYGIEFRDTEDHQVFASWTDNPKYTAIRDASTKFKGFHPEGLAKPEVSEPAPPIKPEEEVKIPLQLFGVHPLDVLALYEMWTGRKIWVPLDLEGEIVLKVKGEIPKSAAVKMVRNALLEQCGVELRDGGDNGIFATWSDNPKYKEVRAAAQRPKPRQSINRDPNARIRVIEPTNPPNK